MRVLVAHNRMGLQISFCHHIKPVFVTQPVQILIIAVMGCTNRIQVILLHKQNIFFLCFMRYIFAVYWIGIMAVCPFHQKLLAIHFNRLKRGIRSRPVAVCIYLGAYKLNLTESKLLGNAAHICPGFGIIQRQNQCIKIWCLCRP